MDNPYQPSTTSGAVQDSIANGKTRKYRWLEILVVVAILFVLVGLLLPANRSAPHAARLMSCTNNLRQLALALQNYESHYHAYPPAFTVDATGRRLHSWRSLILPYIEQQPLYELIDFSKPWDDPANALARGQIVATYRCPASNTDLRTHTQYFAMYGPDACLLPTDYRRKIDIVDGMRNTAMLWEGPDDLAMHWMEPNDPEPQIFIDHGYEEQHRGLAVLAFADGSVSTISEKHTHDTRAGLVDIDDGQVNPLNQD